MTDRAVPHASKLKYSQIFNSNDNQRTGLLTGVQARNILIQSGLSQQILAQIWFLSDCDKDGMLTCEEFVLAMHLIDSVKAGLTLPTTLPPELLPPAIKRKISLASPTLSIDKTTSKVPPPVPQAPIVQTKPPEIPPAPTLVEWNIPQSSKLKYTQLFNQVDANRCGFLTGMQARNILVKSNLSNQHLANIWNLSDIDKDGNLTCEEFILSMHLIDMVKAGDTLPITLPLELIPLNYRKKLSINGPVTGQATPTLVNQSSIDSIGNRNTFEDKRKENFEKGQAELEKRRQLLAEQQKREQEERERKEKEEFEKRERIRLEQERKKKEEMERQLQRQREIEMQKEEERKKQQELKEAARREMERQRLIEWENQKKIEMQATKQRVQEALINLKAKKQRMILDVEQVNSQLNGLKEKVEETRSKVAEAKAEIDKMRVTRDIKLKEMNGLKQQIRTLHERHLFIEQEKLSLSIQLKNLNVIENNNITDSADFALKSKQIRIDQLKQQLVECEKEKEQKEKDIEEHRAELEKYKKAYEEIEERTNELQQIYDDKRKEALEVIEKSIKQAEEASKYGLDLNAGWGDDSSAAVEPQQEISNYSASTVTGVVKYRALYDFEGTNPDDLSFSIGDIINAVANSQPESGWLQGELNGKEGWFPGNFVETIQDAGSVNISSINESATNVNSSLNETYAVVLYDWNGSDPENHLSIKKDDKVKILDTNEDWLFGELDGKNGWLPKTYVNYGEPSSADWYISTFAFESQEPGDLVFDVNELIHVTKKDGEWWTGEITEERKGIFPNTFVREATEHEIAAAGKSTASSKLAPKETSTVTSGGGDASGNWPESVENTPSRTSETAKSKKSKTKKLEIVCAIANYKPTSKEQLELKKGQMIQVRKKLDSGWLMGEIQVKGQKKQIGYFPSSYVKAIGKTSGDDSATKSSSQVAKEEKVEKVVTLYPYAASQEDELSFQGNEVIKILSKEDKEWWRGESESTGKVGLFPSNYTQPYRG